VLKFNKLTQIPTFIGYCSGACEQYSWLNSVLYDVTCNAKAHQTPLYTSMLNTPHPQTKSTKHQVECMKNFDKLLTTVVYYVHT